MEVPESPEVRGEATAAGGRRWRMMEGTAPPATRGGGPASGCFPMPRHRADSPQVFVDRRQNKERDGPLPGGPAGPSSRWLAGGQQDPAQGAFNLLWRLYNDQVVRCLHHSTVQRDSPDLNDRATEAHGEQPWGGQKCGGREALLG